MPARLEFDLQLAKADSARRIPRSSEPMRLLVIADFSGAAIGAAGPLAERPTQRIDVDNFDQVMQRVAPSIVVESRDETFVFAPRSIEDFHPERLLDNVPALARARALRARLANAASFAQAAAELGLPAPVAATEPASVTPPAADLLADLLGGQVAAAPKPAPRAAAGGIDALLRDIVAPHVVPAAPPQQAQYLAAADAALSEQLRGVLHAPAFQALEAVWRGVHWLVSNIELDDGLQLHLLDLRPDEIRADLVAAQGQVAQSGLHQAIVGRIRGQPDALDWSALLPLSGFGPSDVDLAILAALGLLAAQAGAPLLAGGLPGLLGWSSFAAAGSRLAAPPPGWQQLRRSEAAPWISLAAPRLLLRLPYGKGQEPVENLAFEEFAGAPDHEHLLWGSGALAPALMLARAYAADGWHGDPDDHRLIEGLPACVFSRDGERQLQPCAEFLLGDAAAEALRAAGVTALISHGRSAAVQVAPLQSVADPSTGLAGLGR